MKLPKVNKCKKCRKKMQRIKLYLLGWVYDVCMPCKIKIIVVKGVV